MTGNFMLQFALYLVLLLLCVRPLGGYMAQVYSGQRTWLSPLLGWLEQLIYRLAGIRREAGAQEYAEMSWRSYALAVMVFNALGLLCLYLLQRFQYVLPLNPAQQGAVNPDLALNTAVSFVSNTNWQSYGGETTLSYLTQMLGLTVQNFLSAATGMAVLVALIRGFARRNASSIGNFWVDLTRSTLYVLLPLALVLSLALVWQGAVQTFGPSIKVPLVETALDASGQLVATQTIAVGPAASQIAIKQLGTNGGGFFNANSAHPFENPTPLSNLLELLAILLIPAALCHTFGRMVGDTRQGWALLAAMLSIFIPLVMLCAWQEQAGTPMLQRTGADLAAGNNQPGGNMEGKELRFGISDSTIWAAATTAASNGSVNSMHDSYTPLGGMVPLALMLFSEVVFGGAGCGLYGMLVYAILAVFVAGLMVGRTPEYLGKKIESFEMKMASLLVLTPPVLVLLGAAAGVAFTAGRASIFNPGVHGFSEVLYNYASAGNNNGSAFAGMTCNVLFFNLLGAISMFISRYWMIIPILAIAGSLAAKKAIPPSMGTLPTHTPLFVALLVGIVVLVGLLNFVPALALGPIVEHLQMHTPAGLGG